MNASLIYDIRLTIRMFGSGGMPFSVRRVSQSTILLEIVFLIAAICTRYIYILVYIFDMNKKTCRIIIRPAAP